MAVAVSGGRDSVALLYWFKEAASTLGVTFFAVNIDHRIRGEASAKDSAFVSKLCKTLGIELLSFEVDALACAAEQGVSVESAARALRYGVFDGLLADGKCDKVATAHHSADNAETVLMRIFRGTGVAGLAGIDEMRGGRYVRPLLAVSRAAIDAYIAKNVLQYVEDESNGDSVYTRNFVRNELLPQIEKRYPTVESALNRLSRNAAETEAYLKSVTPPVCFDGRTARFKVAGQPELLLKRQCLACFKHLGVIADVEERHLNILVDFATADSGRRLDMPYGVTVYREYGELVFERIISQNEEFIPLKLPFKGVVLGNNIVIEPYDGQPVKKGELVFDASKLPEGAVLRARRGGDRFTKFGGGSKNLGDYLTDIKYPLRLRDRLVVCADGNEVYFVVGVEIARAVAAPSLQAGQNVYKITLED